MSGEGTNGRRLGTPFVLTPAARKIARLQQHGGAVEMRLGETGREAHGFIEVAERVIETALLLEDRREIIPGASVGRSDAARRLESVAGFVQAAGLAERQAEIELSFGVARFVLRRACEQADGFGQAAQPSLDITESGERTRMLGTKCQGELQQAVGFFQKAGMGSLQAGLEGHIGDRGIEFKRLPETGIGVGEALGFPIQIAEMEVVHGAAGFGANQLLEHGDGALGVTGPIFRQRERPRIGLGLGRINHREEAGARRIRAGCVLIWGGNELSLCNAREFHKPLVFIMGREENLCTLCA